MSIEKEDCFKKIDCIERNFSVKEKKRTIDCFEKDFIENHESTKKDDDDDGTDKNTMLSS